jgi:hypothetical protein
MRQSWLFCVIWLCVVAVVPLTVCAQSGSVSVTLRGSVSKTVALSYESTSDARAEINAFDSGGGLTLVVSGSGSERNLRVPILIRSNTSYKMTASVESQTAVPVQLRVFSIAASGKLVAADAISGVVIERRFDVPRDDRSAGEENLSTTDASVPFAIFSGPRISLAGNLNSPDNALKVIFLLSVRPRVDKGSWTISINLQGNSTEL